MSYTNIPILIPAKGHSVRCPNKNKTLLPYMARYLQEENLNGVVLSNDADTRDLAESLGLESWVEHRTEKDDDLSACRKYMKDNENDWFFNLPLTQPFKEHGLLYKMMDLIDTDVDFITTSHIVADRSIFYIENNKFINPSKERKGCLCKPYEMIDGTAYLIRKSFIENVHSNSDFWSGRFKTVVNQAPYIDIDTVDDMVKFKYICNFNEINENR